MLRLRVLLLVPVLLLTSSLLGQPGEAGYPFAVPPLKILAGLGDLKLGTLPASTEAERTLLEKVWTLRTQNKVGPVVADDALLTDAVLFACGVDDPAKQKAARARLEALTTAAREATATAKTPGERAEALLQHLHRTALKGGYVLERSLVSDTLDDGKYNCVSSSVLYYLLGTRLGLKLQPVAIPGGPFLAGHATVDLLDGEKRVQIETTNPRGYDWEKVAKTPGVTVIGIVPDRKKAVDVDGLALASLTYTNRAVALTKEKTPQRLAAAACDAAALALYPTGAGAINNTVATFTNWGMDLTAAGKHEDALRVLAFGASVAPKANALANNQAVAWSEYILSLLRAGKDKEGVEVALRAAKALPRDADFAHPSRWFEIAGDEKLQKEEWEAGLAFAERGGKVLSEAEQARLKPWRSGVYRRWSQTLLEKNDYPGSLKVLAAGYKLDPKDGELHEGIAYHTQEALKLADAKDGLKEARAHYAAIKEQFPLAKEAASVAAAYARRKVSALAKEQKFADALKLADELTPVLLDAEERAEAGATVYDTWAQSLVEGKKLEAVLDKYAEGLKLYPKNNRLVNNCLATIDAWANPSIAAGKWDDAIAVYRTGLKYLPDSAHLLTNLTYCEKKKKEKK